MYEIFSQLLELKNVRPADVARATGLHPSVFTDWKKGKSNPKHDKMQKIADFFGVTVDYLMGNEKAPAAGVDLTADEMELLQLFRLLNALGRSQALTQVRNLSQLAEYTDKREKSYISETG